MVNRAKTRHASARQIFHRSCSEAQLNCRGEREDQIPQVVDFTGLKINPHNYPILVLLWRALSPLCISFLYGSLHTSCLRHTLAKRAERGWMATLASLGRLDHKDIYQVTTLVILYDPSLLEGSTSGFHPSDSRVPGSRRWRILFCSLRFLVPFSWRESWVEECYGTPWFGFGNLSSQIFICDVLVYSLESWYHPGNVKGKYKGTALLVHYFEQGGGGALYSWS